MDILQQFRLAPNGSFMLLFVVVFCVCLSLLILLGLFLICFAGFHIETCVSGLPFVVVILGDAHGR